MFFGVLSCAVLLLVGGGISVANEPGMLSKDQLEPVVYAAIVRCSDGSKEGPA